jgi:hypothetical protein
VKRAVAIGDVYESRDRREKGRRVCVEQEDPGNPGKWICVAVLENRLGTNRKRRTILSTSNLQNKWQLLEGGGDTLQPLLRRLKDVHPDDIAPSLKPLRSAWIKAGCPGLRRDS